MHTCERARNARGASKVRVSVEWLSSPAGARVFCPLVLPLPKVSGYSTCSLRAIGPKVINQQLFNSEKPKKTKLLLHEDVIVLSKQVFGSL